METPIGKRKRWSRPGNGYGSRSCSSDENDAGRSSGYCPIVAASHHPPRKVGHYHNSSGGSTSSTAGISSTCSSSSISRSGVNALSVTASSHNSNNNNNQNNNKVSSSSEPDSTCTNYRSAASKRIPSSSHAYNSNDDRQQDGGDDSFCSSPLSSPDYSGDEGDGTSSTGSSAIYEDSSSGDESRLCRTGERYEVVCSGGPSRRSAYSSWTATILSLDADTMASIMTYLDPPETLRILTAPLCKRWRRSYTAHHDLWRTLCCTDPFAAKLATPSCAYGSTGHQRDGEDDGEEEEERKVASMHQNQTCMYKEGNSKEAGYGPDDDDDDDDDDDSFCSLEGLSDRKLPARLHSFVDDLGDDGIALAGQYEDKDDDVKNDDVLSEFRLLYTSFVRCLNYLKRIEDDARNGRPPSAMTHGVTGKDRSFPTFGVTNGLRQFLASRTNSLAPNDAVGRGGNDGLGGSRQTEQMPSVPIGVLAGKNSGNQAFSTSDSSSANAGSDPQSLAAPKKPKYGNSMITARLLGPTSTGEPSHLNLPANCAMYSIVNWMVAHPNVEGIQRMCICTLPALLEDEQQRLTAQRVGLVEAVLCAMVRFPASVKLHIAAFHSMVLLARPLGGREGMLFDNTMADTTRNLGLTPSIMALSARNSLSRTVTTNREQRDTGLHPTSNSPDGRTNIATRGNTNGISVLLESMTRFESNEKLQATACWAMVNLALVPSQKTLLLSLGGIQAATSAMTKHPKCFDVQFRALFALINLVVPSKQPVLLVPTARNGALVTEKDVLDESAALIARLVVSAMENFCSSETILNRACLVLHNLSQSSDYIAILLWTPHAYQMLEWCITNHSTDAVLRKSASSTLNRMQAYLSQHPGEQRRFLQSLQSEQRALVNKGESTA